MVVAEGSDFITVLYVLSQIMVGKLSRLAYSFILSISPNILFEEACRTCLLQIFLSVYLVYIF